MMRIMSNLIDNDDERGRLLGFIFTIGYTLG